MVRPRSGSGWTRPDEYVAALARKRTARKSRDPNPKDQHEASRFPVHMLPFVALMIVLAVLAIATILTAFPGSQPQLKPKRPRATNGATPPRAGCKEAEKEFR